MYPFFVNNSGFAQEKKADSSNKKIDSVEKKIDSTQKTLGLTEKKILVTAPETIKEKKLETKLQKRLYSFPQFLNETSLLIKQPTKWVPRDKIRFGIVIAATLAVMPFDQRITNSTQGHQRYYYSAPVVGGRIYGEWYSIGAVAGVFGIYGLTVKDTAAKKIAIELLQAGLYSEFFTMILKIAIGRERPIATNDAFTYHPFSLWDYNFHSMPSGHTTSAFALSTVMSRHAGSTALKILAYVPAGFTMFSRIYQHQHWLSDEILAAALGYFAGNWVVDLHEGRRHKINVTALYPLGLSYSF